MKKIRIDIDELAVESFETVAVEEQDARGSVYGAGNTNKAGCYTHNIDSGCDLSCEVGCNTWETCDITCDPRRC